MKVVGITSFSLTDRHRRKYIILSLIKVETNLDKFNNFLIECTVDGWKKCTVILNVSRDQGDEDDVEELRQENVRLQKELEERNSRLSHMSKAYQKTIEEYKETNVELQKNVGIEPATSSLRAPISRPRIGSRTSSYFPMTRQVDDTQEAKDQETNAQETVKPPVRKASKMASFFTVS